jgi:uncharacterized protein
MLKKTALTLTFLAAAVGAQAQTASSPAKKELVNRILKVQQLGIEGMARNLVEQPAAELLGNAANVLPQRVAKEKQDAVAKEIQGDIQKYLDETVPVVQRAATRLAPTAIGGMLEEKFSEDELKQVVAFLESPAYVKFQKMGDDMQKALIDKLVAETRGTVEPKVRALEQTVAKRLGVPPPQASGAGPAAAKPPAKK